MNPALEDTYFFVAEKLAKRKRVLEVGCGAGELARWLARDGFAVTAIDLRLGAGVDRASRNPRFVEGDFLEFEEKAFDAVLFTASLHHISPLDAAVERARGLLSPGGILIADEFDLAAPDAATARWYFEKLGGLAAGDEPLARWRADHEHTPPLHEGAPMIAAIRRGFARVEVTTGAYLYRYVSAGAVRTEAATLMEEEQAGIARGELRAVGLRIVAASLKAPSA